MYINREIDHILLDWKMSDRHKPLILRGVRQCGKTSAVRNLSQQFGDYIELNLEKEPDIGKIFEGELNMNKIINRLELHFSKRISSDTCCLSTKSRNALEPLPPFAIFTKTGLNCM